MLNKRTITTLVAIAAAIALVLVHHAESAFDVALGVLILQAIEDVIEVVNARHR